MKIAVRHWIQMCDYRSVPLCSSQWLVAMCVSVYVNVSINLKERARETRDSRASFLACLILSPSLSLVLDAWFDFFPPLLYLFEPLSYSIVNPILIFSTPLLSISCREKAHCGEDKRQLLPPLISAEGEG